MKGTFLTRTLLCLTLLLSDCLCADDENLEFKIKAGYLYNFTKFITWPKVNSATFNLCIIGADPFGADIGPIEKKSAFSLPIKILRLDEADFLSASNLRGGCQILYVSAANKLKIVFEKIQALPYKHKILVVGESEAFAAEGGMIGFVNRNDKIKLQINLQSVKQTDLKISAKLLEIAELIKEESHD
ncbi:YfiR family protein [Methyloglobulus sp.]|uniref:YfiR family protein n=1 Tax=Methyloglobulus sp. TaxID=2518622 RepID=UPI003989266A